MQVTLSSKLEEQSNNTYTIFNNYNYDHSAKSWSKSYIAAANCVFEHIILNKKLSTNEKLYYILADSLCIINSAVGKKRKIDLSGEIWAKKLNCSRSQVFKMQHNLEKLGYFCIIKDKNSIGQNKRNVISTSIPDLIFSKLKNSKDRRTDIRTEHLPYHLPYQEDVESKRSYLDRTKFFISFSYDALKSLLSNELLSALDKLIWLDLYVNSYKNLIQYHTKSSKLKTHDAVNTAHIINTIDVDNNFMGSKSNVICVVSYIELAKKHSICISAVSRTINTLQNYNYLCKTRLFSKKKNILGERSDKSLWKIELKNISFIKQFNCTQNTEYTVSDGTIASNVTILNNKEKSEIAAYDPD